jgi:hypothetical protein
MKKKMTYKSLPLILILLLFALRSVSAQERPGTAPRPDPRKVFTELIRPYRSLSDYTVKIHAKVDMPAIRVPDFNAVVYFKAPDRIHIETKSFAPLPRNSAVFNPFQFDPEKNRITYERTDHLNGVRAEVFKVEPLETKTLFRYYHVWVGGTPGGIQQVESLSFKGTKGLVKLTYRSVEKGPEKWLLPEKVHIHLTFPEGVQNLDASSPLSRDSPVSSGMRRLDEVSGEGDIYLSYSEWLVNIGIDDRLFQRDKKE